MVSQRPAVKIYTEKSMNTNIQGKMTELKVMSYVIERGFSVSIPFGDKDRYDQIWDINGKLYRIQVKTCHLNEKTETKSIVFKTTGTSNGRTTKYSKQDIDYFATFWENQVYVIPVEETSSRKVLRFESLTNSPAISWAKDYTFEEVFKV